MKKTLFVAAFLLVGLMAFAQTHGVSPSAMSHGSGPASAHGFGVPAGAMSVGPNGFGNAPRFSFRPEPRNERFENFNRDRRRFPVVAPVYVPSYYLPYGYAGGVGYATNYVTPDPAPQPASDSPSNASAYDAGYEAGARAVERDYRVADAAAAAVAARLARQNPDPSVTTTTGPPRDITPAQAREEDQGPATILIFKNGQQRETHNYAIIGQTVIDISGHAARRIPLADLDLPATIKANEERGVDFKIPGRS